MKTLCRRQEAFKIRSLKLGDEGDILTVRNGEIVWEPPQYQ